MVNDNKRIVKVEILHLDELGYGPEGNHTRRQWREECLKYFLFGKDEFLAWQRGWELLAKKNRLHADFSVVIKFDDNEEDTFQRVNILSHALDFSGHVFEKEANASGYCFLQEVLFDNIIVHRRASFEDATFNEFSWFENAEFKAYAWFQRSTFNKDAWFKRAVFNGQVRFRRVSFNDACFIQAQFNDQTYFESANFRTGANFENAQFSNVGHFEWVTFSTLIPSFQGVKIGDTRLEFSDDTYFTQADFTENSIKNISFLKRLADEHGQTDQALNFNAMELRAKRKSTWQQLQADPVFLKLLPFLPWRLLVKSSYIFNGNFWFCTFTWLYEHVSDFGRSFTRPLFYLVVLFFISYLFGIVSAFENCTPKLTHSRQPIFQELAHTNKCLPDKACISISGYRAATEYSLYRSGNFLDFSDADKNTASVNMRLFGSEFEPWWARIFGFVKGILTAVLLFLTALGLRNKYRVS
ncbi:MAG: pentapeptide repeat-containing protein [Methylophilus sp.]|nr:pentapeptide repeat-containing protein [Methylophilus sp.]